MDDESIETETRVDEPDGLPQEDDEESVTLKFAF